MFGRMRRRWRSGMFLRTNCSLPSRIARRRSKESSRTFANTYVLFISLIFGIDFVRVFVGFVFPTENNGTDAWLIDSAPTTPRANYILLSPTGSTCSNRSPEGCFQQGRQEQLECRRSRIKWMNLHTLDLSAFATNSSVQRPHFQRCKPCHRLLAKKFQ